MGDNPVRAGDFKRKNRLFFPGILSLMLLGLGLASCQDILGLGSQTQNESVRKVSFSGDTATVSFHNLERNKIYLVKVNTSSTELPASYTGYARHSYARHARHSHPPVTDGTPLTSGTPRSSAGDQQPAFSPPQTGDERYFWVEEFFDTGRFVQKPATLTASGKYGNIWLMNDTQRAFSVVQAEALAEKFDLIYPLATNLLGYEYGGGPGGNGGRDGDPKIQILVYDIIFAHGGTGAYGYFWAKDYYTQDHLDNMGWDLKSNLAEIFYIDAGTYINSPDLIYSTLVHEFQHMINFNMKSVRRGAAQASDLWYNEMLSMMAEDVISPLIGIDLSNQYHPILERIPVFLERYMQAGITEWDTAHLSAHYAVTYAFGAYLMRNFGGPALLKEILANNSTGISSISSALQKVAGVSFSHALSRFGEAMVFSGYDRPQGTLSFHRTASSTVNGISYTAHGFDIWHMCQRPSNSVGPSVLDLNQTDMRPHSVVLQSSETWTNVSGSFSIVLDRPAHPSVELYLMIR
jgi:hypothetical protein